METYLVDLLIKLNKSYPERYEYSPQYFSDPAEACREEEGILELEELGFIEKVGIENRSVGARTRFLELFIVITHQGRRYLREYLAREPIQAIQETIDQIPDQFQSTRQHLIQARQHLAELDDPRSRKDAVRDCLSALEALVKSISGADDIKAGVKVLRDGSFGADEILREIQIVWQYLHQGDFRDVRHGQSSVHELDQAQALYWIERVLALVNYLSRRSQDGA